MYKIKPGFDPRTPLRVDMRGAAEEDHRKVQEVFFALGYGWRSQKGKPQVVKDPFPPASVLRQLWQTKKGAKYLLILGRRQSILPIFYNPTGVL